MTVSPSFTAMRQEIAEYRKGRRALLTIQAVQAADRFARYCEELLLLSERAASLLCNAPELTDLAPERVEVFDGWSGDVTAWIDDFTAAYQEEDDNG